MSVTTDRSKPLLTDDSQPVPRATRPTLELSLPQVLGGALAAATSALAASFLGVAGTLIGAVVGSVVATIGAAVYSHSLGHAAVRLRVVRVAGPRGRQSNVADHPSVEATSDPHDRNEPARAPRPRPLAAGRRWLRLSAGVALGVVLALAAITVFELVIGHPVSGGAGAGTSIGQAVGAAAPAERASTATSPSPTSGSSTATPSNSATLTAPSASASPGTATAPAPQVVAPTAGTATTAPGASSTGG